MTASHSEQLEHLMAEYRKQFAEVHETQRRLQEISCTVAAPRQTVAVTVGHGGVVKDIKFPTGAYKRMTPTELAGAVLKAITDAQQQATREAAEVIAPSLPPGVDAQKLFSGEIDIQSLLLPEPQLQDATRDAMNIRD
ncbi:YbaB/EbfC family nucleoid-associated protein [Actinosynnema sp. ALI-1.44]|uniref:YbaB/EbfC family nucleoid-associated protein n=1 Tax=Actinosynnema sp. ALI-1.44 TaxID=1933779 RepID=UPI00143CF9F5|nr:YbaB/EbfC family nucleoid-associated protein [Actinosynnema sp. ALI-1.44]